MSSDADIVSLRITLRYKDLDEFATKYAENVSAAGLFLRTKAPKPAGTKIRFELLLADGARALRGEGVVVNVREDDKPGMALRFNLLDNESKAMVDRIVAMSGQGALAPTPLATRFGRGTSDIVGSMPSSSPSWRAVPRPGAASWSSEGAAPRPATSILPRRALRSFGQHPGEVPEVDAPHPPEAIGPPSAPPAAAPSPEAEAAPAPAERTAPGRVGSPLPRKRSSVSRPWAVGTPTSAAESTDRVRVRGLARTEREEGRTERIPTMGKDETAEAYAARTAPTRDDATMRVDLSLLRHEPEPSVEPPVFASLLAEETPPRAGSEEHTLESAPYGSPVLEDRTVQPQPPLAPAAAAPQVAPPVEPAPLGAEPEEPSWQAPAPPEEPAAATSAPGLLAADLPEPSETPPPGPEARAETAGASPELRLTAAAELGESPPPSRWSAPEPATAEGHSDHAPEPSAEARPADPLDTLAPAGGEASAAPEPFAPIAPPEPTRPEHGEREEATAPILDRRGVEPDVDALTARIDLAIARLEAATADVGWQPGAETDTSVPAEPLSIPPPASDSGTPVLAGPIEDHEAVVTGEDGEHRRPSATWAEALGLPETRPPAPAPIEDEAPPTHPFELPPTLARLDPETAPTRPAFEAQALLSASTVERAAAEEIAQPGAWRRPEPEPLLGGQVDSGDDEAARFGLELRDALGEQPDLSPGDARPLMSAEEAPRLVYDPLPGEGPSGFGPAFGADEVEDAPTASAAPPPSDDSDEILVRPSGSENTTEVVEPSDLAALPEAPPRSEPEAVTHIPRDPADGSAEPSELVQAYEALRRQRPREAPLSAPAAPQPRATSQPRPRGATPAPRAASSPRGNEAEVVVTGLAAPTSRSTGDEVPESVRPPPRVGPYRPVIERDTASNATPFERNALPDPAEVKSDFSEEVTEYPKAPMTLEAETKTRLKEEPSAARASDGARVVGIDFGGRWVRMGLINKGELELIQTNAGPYIPALIAARSDGTLAVGARARTIFIDDPGRAVAPRAILAAMKDGQVPPSPRLPQVSAHEGKVQVKLGNRSYELKELLVAFFSFLRTVVVGQVGDERFRVVISIPSELDAGARGLLKEACQEARLPVAALFSEAEAGIRAYALEEQPVDTVLLVDVGATHTGLAVARRGREGFGVAGARWYDDLSAHELDHRVVELTLAELKAQANEDHTQDAAARIKLLEAVEKARADIKRNQQVELKVSLPAPGGASNVGLERTIKLPRSRVYQVTDEVVRQICARVQELLREVGVHPRAVGSVVLAGSAGTYPPLLQALASMTGREPLSSIPPSHVFATGLARGGLALVRSEAPPRTDAVAASIGLELPGGRFRPLIRAGEQLPVKLKRSHATTRDNQTDVEIVLFQGEGEFVRGCARLGAVSLHGVPRAPRGAVSVEVLIELDMEQVATVTLSEPGTGHTARLVVPTQATPRARRAQLAQEHKQEQEQAAKAPPKKGGLLSRLLGRS